MQAARIFRGMVAEMRQLHRLLWAMLLASRSAAQAGVGGEHATAGRWHEDAHANKEHLGGQAATNKGQILGILTHFFFQVFDPIFRFLVPYDIFWWSHDDFWLLRKKPYLFITEFPQTEA